MNTQSKIWLLLAALLTFLVPATVWAEEADFSGSFEAGVSALSISDSDDVKRVNEYPTIREDDGIQGYGKVKLEAAKGGVAADLDLNYQGGNSRTDIQSQELNLDLNRLIRIHSESETMEHWGDHDTLDYLNATMKGSGTTTNTATDKQPAIASDDLTPEEDFMIIRREMKNEADIALPQLPGVTLHVGYRTEEREGTEQAITLSKCAACHVVGESKQINEKTEDLTAGLTGKFGGLTIEYDYLNRLFEEQAAAPTYRVDVANAPDLPYPTGNFDGRLLYDYPDELAYNETPDSQKQSHSAKVRVDMVNGSELVGSYVYAEAKSDKAGDPDIYSLNVNELTSELNAYGAKFKTRLGKSMILTLSGKVQEIAGDDFTLTYEAVSGANYVQNFSSEETRDELDLKADLLIRLAKGQTVRLGYEYEEIDREHNDLGDTEASIYKLAYNGRLSKALSVRVKYQYEDIEDPFRNHNAANVPLTDVNGSAGTGVVITAASGVDLRYGDAFYDRREDDLTNMPEEVHEAKVSTTWSPSSQFSTTLYARVRQESNDVINNSYEQSVFAPGASMWFATTGGLNLTMAYNFNKEETENKMCVGWYHG
ncbi:MAG: hypothetical protein C0623_11070 [Desulfuromonas sp.]|nr:MAG: hypothetical protein C0623_11070 [Desulfuromonas sp.]